MSQNSTPMSRYVTLAEVERLTGIPASALRLRRHRGTALPFPIVKVEGLGLATTEDELAAYQAKKRAEMNAQKAADAA
jgi:hypothetical protein